MSRCSRLDRRLRAKRVDRMQEQKKAPSAGMKIVILDTPVRAGTGEVRALGEAKCEKQKSFGLWQKKPEAAP